LFKPETTVVELCSKEKYKLDSKFFTTHAIQEFSQAVLERFNYDGSDLAKLTWILIFPHPHDMARMSGYAERVRCFVEKIVKQGHKVGVKYHPRQQELDVLNLTQFSGVTVIPATLAFEFVLPFLAPRTMVVADVCTVLMTVKWLSDDVNPVAVLDADDAYQQTFVSLVKSLGIPLHASFDNLITDTNGNQL
jgi:hypothetical protein